MFLHCGFINVTKERDPITATVSCYKEGTCVKIPLCLCSNVYFLKLGQLVTHDCLLIDILHNFIHYVFQHSYTLTAAILFSLYRHRGDTLCQVLTLFLFVLVVFLHQHPSGFRPLLHPVCQFLRVGDSHYYYSSLFAAVVAMATAGVRQRF